MEKCFSSLYCSLKERRKSGCLKFFHLFLEFQNFVHIELNQHDIAIQAHMGNNRRDDPFGLLIQERQDQAGSEVKQQMRKIKVNQSEHQCTDRCCEKEIGRLVQ